MLASDRVMKFDMPAAVLAGGASRRMGSPKAALPYGATTLLAHQTTRLSELFEDVIVVAKGPIDCDVGPARLVTDRSKEFAAIHGLSRALEEAPDRMFILAVDLPALSTGVIAAIAGAGAHTPACALVPEADGRLQPLAAVWRRVALPAIERRIASGKLSLVDLAREEGAEIFPEARWRSLDPSGNSFANLNTLEEFLAARERA